MWDTTSRTLELISKLEGRAPQSAQSLADHLGVTERTVRRDIARLRDLGYPVDTSRGAESGYSLEMGAVLPPIMVTPDEAVVCTLALQHWQDSNDYALSTSILQKLGAAMPQKVRIISGAVAASTVRWSPTELESVTPIPADASVIGTLTRACTNHMCVDIEYLGRSGRQSTRRVEPHLVINASRRWYVIAYDLRTEEWRTFRVDRIVSQRETVEPAKKRDLPDEDLEGWFTRQLAAGWRQVTATVRVQQAEELVREWIAPAWGTLVAESEDSCIVNVGADNYDGIARWLLLLNEDIDVIEPPELADAFRRVATRAVQAAESLSTT
ncbi:MAG: helix-turn-helix transcriptional regulator [Brevibacterium sp.]